GQQCNAHPAADPRPPRPPPPPAPSLVEAPRHAPPNPREFIALHPTFEYRRIIGAPVDGHSPPAHDERDDQQVLVPFDRPIDGQPDGAMRRELDKGLEQHGIGAMAWLQPFIMD